MQTIIFILITPKEIVRIHNNKQIALRRKIRIFFFIIIKYIRIFNIIITIVVMYRNRYYYEYPICVHDNAQTITTTYASYEKAIIARIHGSSSSVARDQ